MMVPVALSSPFKNNAGNAVSLLTGTLGRKGAEIEVWVRSSKYNFEPIVINGKPFTIQSVVQTKNVATGAYRLDKTVFNCSGRRIGVFESVTYVQPGASPTTERFSRERLQLSDVVPDSIGELQLDVVCKIYGP